MTHPSEFQYPLTDRGGCNREQLVRVPAHAPISVSTNGSRGMQPVSGGFYTIEILTFQYPLTDRGGCNNAGFPQRFRPFEISVSTNGSRGMQRRLHEPDDNCDDISVSTNGSRGMQQVTKRDIGKLVTGFQYPLTDRGGCNRFFG